MSCAVPALPEPEAARWITQPRAVMPVAALCCLLWGSAYPAIKSGYALLGIAAADLPSKLVFAGWRFLIAGALLLALAALLRKDVLAPARRHAGALTALGFAQTTLQYVFFYVGLAYTTGVKGSILNATGVFFSVLLAHFLYRNDRLNGRKALGCAVGLAGVMAVNFRPGALDFEFTLAGEGCIVIAALVLSAASIWGKRVSQRMDAMVMTGWQLAIGGALLLLPGYAGGGALAGFTPASAALLLYLALLSSAAFALWSLLLKHHRVSLVSAYTFSIPVFGALLSALFLDESILEWKNALALLLVCQGIRLVTREEAAPPAVQAAGRPAR
jgi:drug/metabolite transporter (DMT)-like permease